MLDATKTVLRGGSSAPRSRCTRGSNSSSPSLSRNESTAASAAADAASQLSCQPRSASGVSWSAKALSSATGSARAIRSAVEVGSFHAPSGSITTWRQPGWSPSHVRTGFDVTMSPTRITSSGASASRQIAEHQVVGGHDQLAVVRAAAELRGRLRQDRVPARSGQRRDRLAQLRIALAPGQDHSPPAVGDELGERRDQLVARLRDGPRHRRQRPPAGASLAGQRVRRRHLARSGIGRQRLGQRHVEVHGPGRAPERLGDGTHRRGAIVEQSRVVGARHARARRTSAPPTRTASAGRSSGPPRARAAPAAGRR